MTASNLQLDSNLVKNTSQIIQPQGAVYSAMNPSTPANSPNNYPQEAGAAEVITGAVITSCIIQTTALPYRVAIQNNQILFYDDTTEADGVVSGHTSQLAFTHTSGVQGNIVSQGFLFEKRASTIDTYDNVLSLYAFPAINDAVTHANTMNYIFIGLQGSFGDPQYNVNVIEFVVNHDNALVTKPSQNGEFNVAGSVDGAEPTGLNIAVQHNSLVGVPGDGFSVFIAGTGTGIVEIGTQLAINGELDVQGDILPTVDDMYDIGAPSLRFRNLYIGGTFSPATITASGSISAGGEITGKPLSLGGNIIWTSGAGSPNGVVSANQGSLYSDTTGGTSQTLWVKESGGGGPTGWVAK